MMLRCSCRSPIDPVMVFLSLVSVQVKKLHDKTLSRLDGVCHYLVKANFEKRIWIREFANLCSDHRACIPFCFMLQLRI